jgi:hypothetical protein
VTKVSLGAVQVAGPLGLGNDCFRLIADIRCLAQAAILERRIVDMRTIDERQARWILRVSLNAGLLLSMLSVADVMNWIALGRGVNIAIGAVLGLIAISGWLSSRWLTKRGLAL